MSISPLTGRGATENPANRFIPLNYEPWEDYNAAEDPAPITQFFRDASRSALATNDSPDIPFTYSLNPYRGCEHGCVYCYARPTHEYLSFSAGLDFETKIMVKEDIPDLLRRQLRSKTWRPEGIALGTVTDPYQPIERRLQLTRKCLEVLAEFRNPVGTVTKNALVARDADIYQRLHAFQCAHVYVSITTLDAELARRMEPRASTPAARLRAVRELADAGIPVGVMFAPTIPGLNDHEMPAVLEAAKEAGAGAVSYVMLRLPLGVSDLFSDWLARHYPERQDKVLGRIRDVRGGKLNDSTFGERMTGTGQWADTFRKLFRITRDRLKFPRSLPPTSVEHFRVPGAQGTLF